MYFWYTLEPDRKTVLFILSTIYLQVQNNDIGNRISTQDDLIQSSLSINKLQSNRTTLGIVKNSVNNRSSRVHTKQQRKYKRRRRRRNVLVSTLDIFDVRQSDKGVYTCAPSNAKNHSVIVHVVKGKYTLMILHLTFVIKSIIR